MRLLHTSDWHLGRSFHRVGLLDAQAEFVDHLVHVVRSESVGLVVVSGDPETPHWDRLYDVRVDDAPEPLTELRRLVAVRRAYLTFDADHVALGGNPELRFWQALGLATAQGKVEEARAVLDTIYAEDDRWRELLRRLPAAGTFPDDPTLLAALTD